MSVSRHHADWLSLVESSGPFVSLPVLLRAFPQGLDPRDPEQAKQLRLAYEEWQENPNLAAKQRAWVMHVLTQVLLHPKELLGEGQTLPPGLTATMAEHGEILRPELALLGPTGSELAGKPQLLISLYPVEQSLDKPVTGKHWKATPGTRMMELLHATDVPLGLVTNGEEWMLVFAPRGDTTGFTSWYASLWIDEPITLRAFHSLLSTRRFFGVAPSDTLLALLKESAQDQQEVTNQLGDQVRDAVEVLIQAFDRLDQDSGRMLLKGLDEKSLYDAALTVMMRLVFLFSAEERGLLHLGEPLYDDNYAVSTLREQLQEVADHYGEEVLERRHDGWARLLATFRAVHGGVNHQDLMLPAYGGSLFDPDRYPFLEGRAQGTRWRSGPAAPLEINNRVVLHLLKSLQMLQVKVPGGGPAEALRISFEGLNIEQVGHVYEGLLDHTAVRAKEVVLGLAASRKKPVASMTLAELEKLQQNDEAKLIELLQEETGRSGKALEKALKNGGEPEDFHKLLVACGQDKELAERIIPFRGLLRQDSFERLVVVLSGGIYVGQGSARRSTGTHYTPRSLTEPIVQHTLEPLVYRGPAEGLTKEQWCLRSPKEILDLKVCDMAMGSGAFLVQACRYLSERLVEAWENLEKEHPGEVLVTPEGGFSQGEPRERLIPKEAAERLAIARRLVADRCLYGVDINPMAVETAKLSIWLITVDKNRSFTFLDHALKCGDSLLGISRFKQLETFSLDDEQARQVIILSNYDELIRTAIAKRRELETLPSNNAEQIASKKALLDEGEGRLQQLKLAADLLIAAELTVGRDQRKDVARAAAHMKVAQYIHKPVEEFRRYADEQLEGRRTLHWPLEFPETFDRGGFDAVIGNPPFMGGTLATAASGYEYMTMLQTLYPPWHGKADLVVGFFKRACTLLNQYGKFSLISTSSLLRGESLDSGLRDLLARGWTIYSAQSPYKWPGTANLEVVNLSFTREWKGRFLLNRDEVEGIGEELTAVTGVTKAPFGLNSSSLQGYLGIKLSPSNREIPYKVYAEALRTTPELNEFMLAAVGGEELYELTNFDQAPRAVDPAKLQSFIRKGATINAGGVVSITTPEVYAHSAPAAELIRQLAKTDLAFACGETSSILRFSLVPNHGWVLKHKLIVFPANSWSVFSILQSDVHATWAWRWGLRRESRLVYSPKRCAATFPLPNGLTSQFERSDGTLANVGLAYHQFRTKLIAELSQGLTAIFNKLHDPTQLGTAFEQLRSLQVALDNAVVGAYGWTDSLGHGFHDTNQGVRFTISESARRTILERLVALNHERHATAVEVEGHGGLREKKTLARSGRRASRKNKMEDSTAQDGLY